MDSAFRQPDKVRVPTWLSGFYTIFAITMAPWTVLIFCILPAEHLSIHWRTMWVVFDSALFVQGCLAAYFLIKKSAWACLPLISLATLFITDMWFDYMTSVTHVEKMTVLKITIAAEIPLTILSIGSAIYVLRQVLVRKT